MGLAWFGNWKYHGRLDWNMPKNIFRKTGIWQFQTIISVRMDTGLENGFPTSGMRFKNQKKRDCRKNRFGN